MKLVRVLPLLMLVVTLEFTVAAPNVAASIGTGDSDLVGSVTVVDWCRNLTDDRMLVYVWMNSTYKSEVTVEAELSFPEGFTGGMDSEDSIAFTDDGSKRETSLRPMETLATFKEPFALEVKAPFYEPSYFVLRLRWTLSDDPSVTGSDEVRLSYPSPPRVESAAQFGVWSVRVATGNPDKGDPVQFWVTVCNWGATYTGPLSINLNIRENSNLYVGFDRGVWAFLDHGYATGTSVRPPRYPEDYALRTLRIYVGPVLRDSTRGLWALNGKLSVYPSYTPQGVSYEARTVTCWSSTQGDGEPMSGHWDFTVTDTGDHDVLVATIRDNWWGTYMQQLGGSEDESLFVQAAFDHPMVLRQNSTDVDVGSFTARYGFSFYCVHVGTFSWDDAAPLQDNLQTEAIHRTTAALGSSIGLHSAWVSAQIDDRNASLLPQNQAFSARENHGFDLGFGLAGIPRQFLIFYYARNNGGVSFAVDGTAGVAINTPVSGDLDRQKEVVLHEICHLLGCCEQNYTRLGYRCIMSGGTGDDTGAGQFRMDPLSDANITLVQNLLQFSGAAYPFTYGAFRYGQWICHVTFVFSEPHVAVQYIDSYPGLGGPGFYWGYSGWYQRFSVADDRDCAHVDADIDYYVHGKSFFFVGYYLNWDSDDWPSSFNPYTSLIGLWWRGTVKECAETTEHSVTNFRVWVVGDDATSSTIYKQWPTFYGDDGRFHHRWSAWPFDSMKGSDASDTETGLLFSDAEVFLLFGFRDAWDYDYGQDIFVEIWQMQLYYQLP